MLKYPTAAPRSTTCLAANLTVRVPGPTLRHDALSFHPFLWYKAGTSAFGGRFMSDMLEVVIDSIRVSLMNQQRIVILREEGAERYLPIWIGVYEAESITIALQEVEVARPLTHDLVKNIFSMLNARVIRVEVVALRDDTFYGNIVAEVDGRTLNIDSRPSDALALAVRTHVPILVSRSVMDTAGIIPEEDLQEEQAEGEGEGEATGEGEGGTERLSVFEDFLEKLEKEDDDEGNEEEDDKK
jgi:bifunctional DNase/RNase